MNTSGTKKNCFTTTTTAAANSTSSTWSRISLTAILLIALILISESDGAPQLFYPNGRYGRRSDKSFYFKPETGSSSVDGKYSENPNNSPAGLLTGTLYQPGTHLICSFTGAEDLFRCSLKFEELGSKRSE